MPYDNVTLGRKNEFMLLAHTQFPLYINVKNPVTGYFHFG